MKFPRKRALQQLAGALSWAARSMTPITRPAVKPGGHDSRLRITQVSKFFRVNEVDGEYPGQLLYRYQSPPHGVLFESAQVNRLCEPDPVRDPDQVSDAV
jgi:hypothetical protein